MKELKDYLPYYLGQQYRFKWGGDWSDWRILTGVQYDRRIEDGDKVEAIQLILRPLSDMTDEECLSVFALYSDRSWSDEGKIKDVRNLFDNNGYYNRVTNLSGMQWNKIINYLRRQGVDMEGLIEAGLAIDKTKISNK